MYPHKPARNHHLLLRTFASALFITLGLSAVAQPTGGAPINPPTNADDQPIVLDRVSTVGSRVKTIDAAGPNPVAAIRRSDLELAGYADVGEALRSLPIVTGSSLSPTASNNSFTPGASTVNIRGLGNNNVLVLLNGRRAAPFAQPGFNGLQTMFDFNSIPSAAVESIEVLKDGGSAIYGSDAVSGVIDIKLRKNYRGVAVNAEVGNTTHTDSLEKSVSVVAGTSVGKTSLVATFDWKERNSIKDHDYSFSNNADLTSRGGPDHRSYAGYPGLAYVPSLEDYYTTSGPVTNPSLSDFGVADLSHGTYNFQSVTDLTPKTRNYGFYLRGNHDFTENLYVFSELAFRRSESVIGAAPTPVFSFNEHGSGPNTETMNIPATNPNNPFGEDLEDEWYARLVHAGNRINDVTSDTPRVLVGVGGKLPDTTWTWEAGALHTRNTTKNLNHGSVFDNLYQDALNGINVGGQTLYANPFGPEDARVTDYYTGSSPNSSKFVLQSLDFSATGDVFQLPAGAVGVAFGGEARKEKFEDNKNADNISGNIVGGAEGASVKGDRTVKAAYVEVRFPIVTGLELQAAGRFENYSDFGSTTKPKIALSYRPTKWLLFRGSYGESFLAPNLSYLYSAQTTQFSNSNLVDPKRPADSPRQIVTRTGGNLKLQPEETTTWYTGVRVEPTSGPLKGWGFGVDWFEFNQKQLIGQRGEDYILKHEDTLPGAIIRNAPAAGEQYGTINYIVDFYTNADSQKYRGIDAEITYELRTKLLGRFHFAAGATYLGEFTFQGDEYERTYLYPRWRGTFTTDWQKGNWSAAVFVNYTGRFDRYVETDEDVPSGEIASQVFVNPQISYSGFFDTKITLGARNIFDRDPPFDPHQTSGWNSEIHTAEKQFVYLRVSREF